MPGATLFDEARNLYVTSMEGVWKFSPDGQVIWHYTGDGHGHSHANPSLMNGALFGSTLSGVSFALSMETGKERWSVKNFEEVETDTPSVEASDGMVFAIGDKRATKSLPWLPGNTRIVAMGAKDGRRLWEHKSDEVLWNFHPMFVGDGTFVMMDVHGGVYRVAMVDGKILWHTPPPAEFTQSFSDGGVILGPGNSVAYTCSSKGTSFDDRGGALRAYRVSDGQLLWDRDLPQPCVSWPAVDANNRTVVVPIGPLPFPIPPTLVLAYSTIWVVMCIPALHVAIFLLSRLFNLPVPKKLRTCFCCLDILAIIGFPFLHLISIWLGQEQYRLWQIKVKPMEVHAFDAQTGEPRWRFDDIQPWGKVNCRNDEEEFLQHKLKGHDSRPVCGPASWSSPTIDGRGTVFVAGMNGIFYAIRDADGDGIINSKTEVSQLDIGSASLHGGAAFAPGLMAFSSCNRLHVFQT